MFGEIFVDQKFMGIFSLLFGTSVALFAKRAEQKGESAVRLSLWRNALLLVFGLCHALLWSGDVLAAYALCAPFVIFARELSPRLLPVMGVALVLAAALAIVTGARPSRWYRRAASIGLLVGLPLAAVGVGWSVAAEFSPEIAIVSTIPNTLGTIP